MDSTKIENIKFYLEWHSVSGATPALYWMRYGCKNGCIALSFRLPQKSFSFSGGRYTLFLEWNAFIATSLLPLLKPMS